MVAGSLAQRDRVRPAVRRGCRGRPPNHSTLSRTRRLIDTTVPWADGVLQDDPELVDPPPLSPDLDGAALSLVDPAVSAASSSVSEIDVLVVYTPPQRRTQGARPACGRRSSGCSVKPTRRDPNRSTRPASRQRFRCRIWIVGSAWDIIAGTALSSLAEPERLQGIVNVELERHLVLRPFFRPRRHERPG